MGHGLQKRHILGQVYIVCIVPPAILLGGWTSNQILKKGEDLTLIFVGGLVGKRGGELFESEGSCNLCNFYVKDKLKSEIFNDKKSL